MSRAEELAKELAEASQRANLLDLPGDASGKTDYPIIGVNLSN